MNSNSKCTHIQAHTRKNSSRVVWNDLCFYFYFFRNWKYVFLFCFILYGKLETHLLITIIIDFRRKHVQSGQTRGFCMCHTHMLICECFFTFLYVCRIDLHAGLLYSRKQFSQAKIVWFGLILKLFVYSGLVGYRFRDCRGCWFYCHILCQVCWSD